MVTKVQCIQTQTMGQKNVDAKAQLGERAVIRFDRPEEFEEVIQKYRGEKPEEWRDTALAVSMVAIFAAAVIGVAAASLFMVSPLIPGCLVAAAAVLAVATDHRMRSERALRDGKVADLQACQKALELEKFQTFAVSNFGVTLSEDDWIEAHRLFQLSERIEALTVDLNHGIRQLAGQQ